MGLCGGRAPAALHAQASDPSPLLAAGSQIDRHTMYVDSGAAAGGRTWLNGLQEARPASAVAAPSCGARRAGAGGERVKEGISRVFQGQGGAATARLRVAWAATTERAGPACVPQAGKWLVWPTEGGGQGAAGCLHRRPTAGCCAFGPRRARAGSASIAEAPTLHSFIVWTARLVYSLHLPSPSSLTCTCAWGLSSSRTCGR